MLRKQSLAALAGLILSSSNLACVIGVDTTRNPGFSSYGDLTLSLKFNGSSCLSAGVDRVHVSLQGERYGYTYEETYLCESSPWGVSFENLREDRYDVYVEGRSFDGRVLYVSSMRNAITVYGASHQDYELSLNGGQGDLSIYWTFDGSGSCGAVTDVRVTLIDPNGYVYDDSRYDCDYLGVTFDALEPGTWKIFLDGVDAYDRNIYQSGGRPIAVYANADNVYTIDLGVIR